MDELNEVDDALYAAARKAREVAQRVKDKSEPESPAWFRAEEILEVCEHVLD